jgi:hypothetical protein
VTYAATEWDDWFVHGDESAVLVGGRVIVLSALATAVVDSTVRQLDLVALTEEIVQRFGRPPDDDADVATAAVLDELVDAGILRRTP